MRRSKSGIARSTAARNAGELFPLWAYSQHTMEEGQHLLVLGVVEGSGAGLRKPFLGAGGATWRRPEDTQQAARTEAGLNGRLAFWLTAVGGCMLVLAGLSSLV